MKPIPHIEWNRAAEGLWFAKLIDSKRHRYLHFRAVNVGRRNWILSEMDFDFTWFALLQVKTWRECREYVEERFTKWMDFADSSQTTDPRDHTVTSINANTSQNSGSNVQEYQRMLR